MRLKTVLSIIVFLYFSQLALSQHKIPDSLKNYSFEQLKDLFFKTESNFKISNVYAKSYLTKAKIAKDTFRLAQGYKYLSYIERDSIAVQYVDSIIIVTKDFKNDIYPAFGYFIKGSWLCNLGKEKEGFDNYLIAKEFAKKQNNPQILNDVKQSIGSLKLDWGEYEEALEIFEDYYNFIKQDKNYREKYEDDLFILLHNLGIAYTRNKKYDKASEIIKEGIIESKRINDDEWEDQFIFNLSTNQYFEENYNDALINLKKSINTLEGASLAINYYYQGKIYEKNKDSIKSLNYYVKVDSVYTLDKESFSELRDVYSKLLSFSRTNKNQNKQYEYINKFLKVDSILDKREQKLKTDIIVNYDIPELKNERDHLKDLISGKEKKSFYTYVIFGITLIIFFSIGYYFYKKQKLYKKRFELILNNNNIQNNEVTASKPKEIDLNISIEVINDVLLKLEKFESLNKFTQSKISLNSLSKDLQTNSTYLSKIINHHKNQSFSNYINSLRINYIISEFKTNSDLRKYTIAAIANEAGFNNAESFSKAFFKETGIYPSYFIKELKKKKLKNSLNL